MSYGSWGKFSCDSCYRFRLYPFINLKSCSVQSLLYFKHIQPRDMFIIHSFPIIFSRPRTFTVSSCASPSQIIFGTFWILYCIYWCNDIVIFETIDFLLIVPNTWIFSIYWFSHVWSNHRHSWYCSKHYIASILRLHTFRTRLLTRVHVESFLGLSLWE